jgi:cation transporter-like permease
MRNLTEEQKLTIKHFAIMVGKGLVGAAATALTIYVLSHGVDYFGLQDGAEFVIVAVAFIVYMFGSLMWSSAKNKAYEEIQQEKKVIERLSNWKE